MLVKINAIYALDTRRTLAGMALRVAGAFDNNIGDAFFQFGSAHVGTLHALLIAAMGSGAGTLHAFAAAEDRTLPAAQQQWGPVRGSPHKISYLRSGQVEDAAVVEVTLPATIAKDQLEALGKLRFDTRFVRNIFFIVNVVRLVRLKLNRELTQSRNVLVSSHLAVAPGVTEYGMDPFGPNEDLESNYPGHGNTVSRFNDSDQM